MQKPLVFSIAACLGLAGCQVFEKSKAWEQAIKVQPGATRHDPDPSHAYAARLHEVFARQGIEHKVVVYQYRYTTRRREEAVATQTAVIYRDDSNSRFPWWLKDDRSFRPVWLPNGGPARQISFYRQRKAEIIEEKHYPARGTEGKTSLATNRPAPAARIAAKPSAPGPVTRIAPVKRAPTPVVVQKPAAPPVVKRPEEKAPVRKVVATAPAANRPSAVTRIKPVTRSTPAIAFFAPQPAPKTEAAPLETTAPRNSAAWSAPSVLDPKEQSSLTAPADTQMEKRFRARHGTDFNRFSPTDRRKMQQLQQGVASAE